jgi:hypothetical protein
VGEVAAKAVVVVVEEVVRVAEAVPVKEVVLVGEAAVAAASDRVTMRHNFVV